ncbi:sulfite exporter TauE/SafE family protein [Bradyrhizobium sp. SK17]|uniref:sulfite exporter TauE/SafE family protein n=1 Tax=Bradyrhizobium sp. SK17 TaxID=2057741 RepID=UPI00267C8C0D
MTIWSDGLAFGSGGLVGFSLGLIGGGGSILATPLLLYVVGLTPPHLAIGTGALAVAANAFLNFTNYARRGTVRWRSALVFAIVGSVGAFVGSSVGKAINGDRLLFLFGLLMLVVGGLMLRTKRSAPVTAQDEDARPWLAAATALVVGLAAGFFGIGGGFLIVPGLIFATGMPMINAIGTSLLAVGAFGLTTAVNYALSGLIDWTVAAEFIGGGFVGGLIGMRLASHLSQFKSALNIVFASLIFVVAIYVLYRSGLTLFT